MPQTGPSALQLVEAVREFLQTELQPVVEKADPARAFHLRVAANALMIVERELLHGPAADAGELQRLRQLLGRDGTLDELNATLAGELRRGVRDESDPALLDHLERTVRDKIAIANPKWR